MLHEAKVTKGVNKMLKKRCWDNRSNVKKAFRMSKGTWVEHLVEDVNLINEWEQIIKINIGFAVLHENKSAVKFRNDDGKIEKKDTENAHAAAKNFEKVFNRDASVDWEHAKKVKSKRGSR